VKAGARSLFDLAVIGTDARAVRRSMRPHATLVLDDEGGVSAIGTFGQVSVPASRRSIATHGFSESYTAAICAEYARPRALGESAAARWHRLLHG
jgi:hypothetical protein